MSDIFLSYNREDQARARLFAEQFAAAGFTVWWDVTLRSGDAYDEVTEAALRGAKAVVVLWSPRSVVSRWVRAEATIADRCKTLMPATIEPCERPIMFELTQTTDLIHWHGDVHDKAWLGFLGDVRRLIEQDRQWPSESPALAQTAPPPAMAPKRPSLAILPFSSRTGDADDADFGDALAEDITASLALGRGLRVLAHGIIAGYAGKAIDVRRIGTDHGVDYVLEGNLRRMGTSLRVTAQLVDGQSGAILWTQKFDRHEFEGFSQQDDLVDEISNLLGVQIQRIELSRVMKMPDANTPWEAIKRCWALIPKLTVAALEQAVAHGRRAVELAPEYGLAQSSLGMVLGVLYQRNGSRQPVLLAEAIQRGERALALSPDHGTVLFQVALIKYYAQEWEESLRLSERAVEINPHVPEALHTLAGALTRFERYDEALALLDRADHFAPHGYGFAISLINRCWALFGAGRIDQALETANRLLQVLPSDHTGLMLRPVFHAARGEWELARQHMAELHRVFPDEDLELFMGTIQASRQADIPRARNAELFRQVWDMTSGIAPPDEVTSAIAG
jgi:TolB-like protein/Tfp pilus assembly protein PilF